MTRRFWFNRKVALAFGTIILIVFLVAGSSFHALGVSTESNRWVSHTHEVLDTLKDLRNAMEATKSSFRGFALTGQEPFLESYRAAISNLNRNETIIRDLTADNLSQKPRLEALDALEHQTIQFAQKVIQLRQDKGLEQAAALSQTGEGLLITNQFQQVIQEVGNEELRLLAIRDADAKRRSEQARAILTIAGVVTILLAFAAVWRIEREFSARGLAEKEVGESEERFRTLANNISQFAWMADGQGSIFWYNQRFFDFTGITLEQMDGPDRRKIHHPDHRQRVVDKLADCFRTGTVWEDTFPLRGRDGSFRWFLSRAVPIRDASGNLLRWFGTNTDITERLNIEKDLEKANESLRVSSRKLEASNLELRDFASVASHDLQEPLRKVQVFGTRLKNGYATALDTQGNDYVDRMLNAARRMQTLIEDLLAFSRVTTQTLPFVPVDLNRVTRDVLSDLEVRIAETGALMQIAILPTIEADPRQMNQLLQNLISNALKFRRKDHSPVVRVYAENDEAGGLCRLFVADNGIGFDQKYLDRIFTVFQRLHGKAEYEGTGIGLAICRKIANRHGGEITAKSSPGEGATFVVTLQTKHIAAESPGVADAEQRRESTDKGRPELAASLLLKGSPVTFSC